MLSGKKVLVTGASGFVGSHLTRRLLENDAQVAILVRPTSDQHVVTELKRRGAQVFYGDVCNKEAVDAAVQGNDFVFHIAALFRQAKFPDSAYYDINVTGTSNVLDAVKRFGVQRIVHCSTVGVHSHIPNPPADEQEQYRPGDVYQASKCEGEKLALRRFAEEDIDGVVIRPAMIWGDGDRRMLKLYRGVARRRFPIIGDGSTLTHWVYVHDLVEAFLLAARSANARGQVYIIAGERAVTISELVSTIASAAGVRPLSFCIPARPVQSVGSLVETICRPLRIEPPIYRRRVDFFTKNRSFNITKAKTQLGYVPRYSFEQEVEAIYRWYQNAGWLN